MRLLICSIIIGLAVGTIWYIHITSKPSILRNEANGDTDHWRFKGYKESLKTPINPGADYGHQGLGGKTAWKGA